VIICILGIHGTRWTLIPLLLDAQQEQELQNLGCGCRCR
jgi:hypothetical protein